MRKREYNGPQELPKRGYAKLIKEQAGRRVTIAQIQNYYQGKAVSLEAQEIIVKATEKAIKLRNVRLAKLKKLQQRS